MVFMVFSFSMSLCLPLRLSHLGSGRSGNVSPLPPPPYTDRARPLGRRRSCPQPSLPSLTAAGGSRGSPPPQRPRLSASSISTSSSPCYDTDPQVLRLCGQFPLSPARPATLRRRRPAFACPS